MYDKKWKYFLKQMYILYVVRLEPTISTLTAKSSIQMAKRAVMGTQLENTSVWNQYFSECLQI